VIGFYYDLISLLCIELKFLFVYLRSMIIPVDFVNNSPMIMIFEFFHRNSVMVLMYLEIFVNVPSNQFV